MALGSALAGWVGGGSACRWRSAPRPASARWPPWRCAAGGSTAWRWRRPASPPPRAGADAGSAGPALRDVLGEHSGRGAGGGALRDRPGRARRASWRRCRRCGGSGCAPARRPGGCTRTSRIRSAGWSSGRWKLDRASAGGGAADRLGPRRAGPGGGAASWRGASGGGTVRQRGALTLRTWAQGATAGARLCHASPAAGRALPYRCHHGREGLDRMRVSFHIRAGTTLEERAWRKPRPTRPATTSRPMRSRSRSACCRAACADGIDLYNATRQAHWNVKGPHFGELHKLFEGF